MATRNMIGEVSIFESKDRVVARIPESLEVEGFGIRLDTPGSPHRWVGRLTVTRVEGAWQRSRRSGRCTVDVVPAGNWGALVTVVLHQVPLRFPDGAARLLAKDLQVRVEADLPVAASEDDGAVAPVPLAWNPLAS